MKGKLYRPMGQPAPCGVCGGSCAWHDLREDADDGMGYLPSPSGSGKVSLCLDDACENGAPKTAERMGWQLA